MVDGMLRYKEIKLTLKELIAQMSDGDRLPSRSILSRQLDSSRVTVDKAIRELEEEGILTSRFGSGTYVSHRLEGMVVNARNWCLIVPDIREDIYAKLASSVENEARKWNTNVILCNSENSAENQDRYIKRLIVSGTDGFIIVPVIAKSVLENVGLYQSLLQSKVPFVFCNREVEGISVPLVKSNDFYGGYIATLHLIDQGYRNIAYLAQQRYRTSIERCHGYISALQCRGIEVDHRRILMHDNGTLEDCYSQLKRILKSDVPMDAVFCFCDVIALEAMRCVEDANLQVSEDIGIIGYNDDASLKMVKPGLTTISYRMEEVGRTAAEVLRKKIECEMTGNFDYYLVQPEIVVRESCLGLSERGSTECTADQAGQV